MVDGQRKLPRVKNMPNKYKSFEEIPVWKISHRLALEIYRIVKKFPLSERFILISQLIRAALSIPANIAEGFYRNTTKELLNFLYISRGSCGEVTYYLILAKDLHYISDQEFSSLKASCEDISKQLSAWIRSLKK